MATEIRSETRRYGAGRATPDWPATGRPPQAPEERMGRAAQWDGRSVAHLLRELSGEAADLARLEIELAKTEMYEKVEVFQSGTRSMIIGGAVLLAGLLSGLWAINLGLTALLAQFMDMELAVWVSPLILAVLFGAIGWGMIASGKQRMSEEGIAPTRTRESLLEDRDWARRKATEVKQEMKEESRHG